MAGCCPGSSPAISQGAAGLDPNGPQDGIRPGEAVECYMARGGNLSGAHDDATDNVLNIIKNTTVPITRSPASATLSVQFELTAGSTRVPTSWTMTVTPSSSTLALTTSGLLTGNFTAGNAELEKVFKLEITATDGTGVIDHRPFTVVASLGGANNELRLISPLPGGIVNSKFGPRLHPISGEVKPHTGIDMKLASRAVTDIVAAADGEVILISGNSTDVKGYGLRVHVRHATGNGIHLATTTYNHLNDVYVKTGQKLMAGQALGKEGKSGGSTGNHLHFEVKLPDGKFVDPEPLINGSLGVAQKTLPNGDADPSTISTKNSTASLSASEVKAKQASCPAFGPGYPAAVPPPSTFATPGISDPFELAWNYTLSHEVGSWWLSSAEFSPGDSELDAGLCSTPGQKRKTGFTRDRSDKGGLTKFGISQNSNLDIDVVTMDYATAKNRGYNNYWKAARSPCATYGKIVAIMVFDMNYLFGPGGAHKIYTSSGITSALSDTLAVQRGHADALNAARVQFVFAIGNKKYETGWLKRAAEVLAFAKSQTL